MPDREFDKLRTQLLESGVAPRHVVRIAAELSDHYEDLEFEALRNGFSREAASHQARTQLGEDHVITQQVLSRPELLTWTHRYPRVARVLMPIAFVLLLPAAPVIAGVGHAQAIGRWLACLMLSGVITAAMMLVMQLAILIS